MESPAEAGLYLPTVIIQQRLVEALPLDILRAQI